MERSELNQRLEKMAQKFESRPGKGRRAVRLFSKNSKIPTSELRKWTLWSPDISSGLAQSVIHTRGREGSHRQRPRDFFGDYAGAFITVADEVEGRIFCGNHAGEGSLFEHGECGLNARFYGNYAGANTIFMGDLGGAGAQFVGRGAGAGAIFEGYNAGNDVTFEGPESGSLASWNYGNVNLYQLESNSSER